VGDNLTLFLKWGLDVGLISFRNRKNRQKKDKFEDFSYQELLSYLSQKNLLKGVEDKKMHNLLKIARKSG